MCACNLCCSKQIVTLVQVVTFLIIGRKTKFKCSDKVCHCSRVKNSLRFTVKSQAVFYTEGAMLPSPISLDFFSQKKSAVSSRYQKTVAWRNNITVYCWASDATHHSYGSFAWLSDFPHSPRGWTPNRLSRKMAQTTWINSITTEPYGPLSSVHRFLPRDAL